MELRDLYIPTHSNNDTIGLPTINLTDMFQLHKNEDSDVLVVLTRLDTCQLKLAISIEYRNVRRNRDCVKNTYFAIPIYLNNHILEYLPDGKMNMEFLINFPDDYPYHPLVWNYSRANYTDDPSFDITSYCNNILARHTCNDVDHSPANTILKSILSFISVNLLYFKEPV